jgi:hypothetical protein
MRAGVNAFADKDANYRLFCSHCKNKKTAIKTGFAVWILRFEFFKLHIPPYGDSGADAVSPKLDRVQKNYPLKNQLITWEIRPIKKAYSALSFLAISSSIAAETLLPLNKI